MENPLVNTVSVAIYLFIVKYAGPKFMENRKPFEFRRLLFVYNIGLVLLSAWMFYEVPFIIMSYRLFRTTANASIRADSGLIVRLVSVALGSNISAHSNSIMANDSSNLIFAL